MLSNSKQTQQFLGSLPDTKRIEIRLPKDKIQKIKKEMKGLLAKNTMTIRKLAAITGLLRSTAADVFPSKHIMITITK
jgi:hypothetical protein